jgi:hypothetical protein
LSKRPDAIGFFWEDVAAVKPPKQEKVKRTPPERTWEHPDYLPGLYEALAFKVELLTDADLFRMQGKRLMFDIECYSNYFLAAFRDPISLKVAYFELGPGIPLDVHKLAWMLDNFCIVGFNSKNYDICITALAVAGKTTQQLKWATNEIIINGSRPQDVLRGFKVKKLDVNHIDLIEVAPLSGSLKKYAARLHIKRMQDLPFPPETLLTYEQAMIVRWYCINSDLPATIALHDALREQLSLRESMSWQYKTDLRSKSDAQIAETVIAKEVEILNGTRPKTPEIPPGTKYRYQVPAFMKFESPLLNWALERIRNIDFIVSDFGNINLPEELTGMSLRIAGGDYRIGTGGLHSSEQSVAHIADHTFQLLDCDVESFYPRIILNQGLYPQHLGLNFLKVYQTIVDRRVHAKHMQKQCKASGDKASELKWKVEQESLKITINGSFGKLGSPFSVLYAPELLIQVTLTGQLSLLMLIERMELACVSVVSANTDGIVMRVATGMKSVYEAVVKQWEKDTNYITEETEYSMLLSRDVNNYIAIKKKDGETKNKGAFANPWSISENIWRLHKNPVNMVCVEAIEALLTKKVPIEKTIRECRDIYKFATVRDVRGGAVKLDADGKTDQFMGKMVRWYYAKDEPGEIVYALSGKKVARSVGAKPMMDLPDKFPEDVDHQWYINEAENMLKDLGYT